MNVMNPDDRHLDLGCGKRPRNPYGRRELHGVDVRPAPAGADFQHRVANLTLEPIPYEDSSFGSVSAYDFIEHIPRILPTPDGRGTVFPFIRLMNEIWRVLAPGGRLYALTPGYPHAEAFMDPTHVNFITEGTHEYFCGDKPLGRIYGFDGHFRLLRCEWVDIAFHHSAAPPPNRAYVLLKRFSRRLRSWSRRLRGKRARGRRVYLLWELEAVKP
jgi:SAM-dependent methyltransferase